jgi:hypothetical protein
MGLQLRRAPLVKVRSIVILIAAVVLTSQAFYGLASLMSTNAEALSQTVVRPGAMNGWVGIDDNGNGGSLTFPEGPATPPLGTGSAQLKVSATNQGYLLFKPGYGAVKLADLSALSYKTYVQTGNNLIAPSLQINIDRDTTDADTSWQGRLVYEPYMSSTVTDGQWQTWNPLDGKWWLTKPEKFDGHCGQSDPCTVAQLKDYFANIGVDSGINAGIGFKAGSSWASFMGNIDDVVINQDRYNFESIAAPTNLTPVNNASTNNPSFDNTWSKVDGASKYEYITKYMLGGSEHTYNDTSDAGNYVLGGSTITRHNNGAPESTYAWKVRAIDATGTPGAWSTESNVTVDTTKPDAPTLNSPANNAVANGATLVNKWNAASGAVKYVYQSYNNAAATSIRWTETTTSLQKSATNVANGTIFWWRVKAIDAAGNESGWSDLWKVTIDNTAPSVPTGGTPHETTLTTNDFYFNWNASTDNRSDALNYEFRASQNAGQVGAAADNSGAWMSGVLPSPTIHSTGAGDGTWYWQVRSIDAAGNKSAWSQVWNVTLNTAVVTPPVTAKPIVSIDPDLSGRTVTGLVSVNSADFTVTIDGVVRSVTVTIGGAVGDKFAWSFDLPENVTSGAAHDVKVVATKDGQSSDEANETFFIPVTPGGGTTSTDTSGIDPLLEQLRTALAQPFVIPNTFAIITPSVADGQTNNGDAAVLGTQTAKDPATDQNAKTVAVAATENGWKLFGILWYWWLLLLVVLGYLSYRTVAKRRSDAQDT